MRKSDMCCLKSIKLNESAALFDYFFLYQKLALSKHQAFLFPLNKTPLNHFDLFSCNFASDHVLLCCQVTQITMFQTQVNCLDMPSVTNVTDKCQSCNANVDSFSTLFDLFCSRSRIPHLLLTLLLQAMSFCDYSVDICLKMATCSAAKSNSKIYSSKNPEKPSVLSLVAVDHQLSASSSSDRLHHQLADAPTNSASVISTATVESDSNYESSVTDSDSVVDTDTDDEDYNWASFDYPELTLAERAEYNRLKEANNAADWICICCAGARLQQRNSGSRPAFFTKRQVSFDQQPSLVHEIDSGPYAAEEYRSARRDAHLIAKFSFQADVQRAERFLSRILAPTHREQMRAYIAERFDSQLLDAETSQRLTNN